MKNFLALCSVICTLAIFSCSEDTTIVEEQVSDNSELVLRSNSECPDQTFRAFDTGMPCTTSGPHDGCEAEGRLVVISTFNIGLGSVAVSPFDGTAGTDCAGSERVLLTDGVGEFCLLDGVNTFHLAYPSGCQIINL